MDIYPSGKKMSAVPYEFKGLSLKQWRKLDITAQCDAWLATQDPDEAPLSKQRVWNPRDSYGMKGL